MPQPLFTVGYEGKTVDELLDALKGAGIELLIDVRAVAASRRPGFSKTALAGALAEQGIDYLHLRPLGTPKAGREAARKGRIAEMRTIFEEQLDTPEAQVALARAGEESAARRAALLCFEADAGGCHRRILGEQLIAGGGFELVDL